MPSPTVTRLGILDAQVCVPKEWTDEQVIDFFKAEAGPCAAKIRKEGDPDLNGDPERAPCSAHPDYVHIVLDY